MDETKENQDGEDQDSVACITIKRIQKQLFGDSGIFPFAISKTPLSMSQEKKGRSG